MGFIADFVQAQDGVVELTLPRPKFLQQPLAYATNGGHTLLNKTCQGYARKCTLKPAGYFFCVYLVHRKPIASCTNDQGPFRKSPTIRYQQVEGLRDRSMVFEDLTTAKFYLQHLNDCRLSAYWLPFKADHDRHRFQANRPFGRVLNLYLFDRELRLVVLDAIERVKVSVRCN